MVGITAPAASADVQDEEHNREDDNNESIDQEILQVMNDDDDEEEEDEDEVLNISTEEEDDEEDSDEEYEEDDEAEEDVDQEASTLPNAPVSPWIRAAYRFLLHLFCIMIYVIPMIVSSPSFSGDSSKGAPSAVLDELHIVSESNRDVNGDSTLKTIFSNDYWGRPMSDPSSHKSWRPFTILSFRYVQGIPWLNLSTLTVHRLVNTLTHACLAEMVAILATKLLGTLLVETSTTRTASSSSATFSGIHSVELLYVLTKLLFALHPTHVEVTSNAANRPHLLAALCGCVASDIDVPLPVFVVMLVSGYLCCETFLFQVPAILMTLFILSYLRLYHGPHQVAQGRGNILHQIKTTLLYHSTATIRVVLTVLSALLYLAARVYYDTLSIPDGLIRPAENPFYALTGWKRVYSYLYVLSIHVFKAWDWDFVGFSHEYGHACIRVVHEWTDARLCIPVALFITYTIITLYLLLIRQRRRSVLSVALLLYLFHVAWMLTLFPISGIVKVGTFVADRIVVASTVSVSIFQAYAVTLLVLWIRSRREDRKQQLMQQAVAVFAVLALLMWRRIHLRSLQWMDSLPLLQSSLKTCPNFAKAHMELSKVYSGLYPNQFNLTKSRWHLQQAEFIDPDFCDVNQQFAHVAIQENKFMEFEERLAQALTCQFGRSTSIELWRRYWTMVQDPHQNSATAVEAAKKRFDKYLKQIQQYIDEEDVKGQQHRSSSPLVGWKWGTDEF